MGAIVTTVTPLGNGATAVVGVAKRWNIAVSGMWLAGDKLTLLAQVTQSGAQEIMGAGRVTGLVPTFLLTYKKKLYFLSGTDLFFSVLDAPTLFNPLNTAGNGQIQMANNFSTPENLVALSIYQGGLGVFGVESAQVWTVDANPANYSQRQVLESIGTKSKFSVKSIGTLDTLFLHDSGVRSLRVKDTTEDAFVVDIGSAIDIAIVDKLAQCTEAEIAAACGIVENGRYWLFLKDTIFVLSYYPSAKITAWATYFPTYQSADVMRVTNNGGSTFIFKIGMVNDESKATQVYTLANGATQVVTAGKYIFLSDAAGTPIPLSTTELPGGVAFRGQITFASNVFSFTSNQTSFVPEKFVTQGSQVFASASDAIYAHGGDTGVVYDNAVGLVQIPWLDADSPEQKTCENVITSMVQAWALYASMDYISEEFTEIHSPVSTPTYDGGKIPFSSTGSHFGFIATTSAAAAARLAAVTFTYKK
jgi:hypothetical protein